MNYNQLARRRFALLKPPVPEGGALNRKIPDTLEGIEIEVGRMCEYVRHYSGDPDIVVIARRLVENCPDKDKLCESTRLYQVLIQSTRFVLDPTRKELLQTPRRMLRDIGKRQVASGDCDELATLAATMFSAIGHRPRFVFGELNMGWQHVWVQDLIAGRYVDFDLAEKLPIGRRLKFRRYGVTDIWK